MPETVNTVAASLLAQRHPWHSEMYGETTSPWRRYRAFSGDLDSLEDRKVWLPCGAGENVDDYKLRVKLAELLAWSGPAVDRMSGRLTRDAATVTYEDDVDYGDEAKAFVAGFQANADGAGRSMASWWGDFEPDVLRMGIGFAEVARDGDAGSPYLVQWRAEELVDWGVDARGMLTYAVLYRQTADRADWSGMRQEHEFYRVLTRTTGHDFQRVAGSMAETYGRAKEWTHNLGIVPLVPCYARREGPLRGRSYIDLISSADLAAYRLQADQFHCSWLHANPLLAKWGEKSVGTTLNVGINRVQHLNAGSGGEGREDIKYVTFDANGMDVRRKEIEAVQSQALQASGVDPSLVTSGGSGNARSGASIAWSFSTAEEPALNAFTEEMDAADRLIFELVERYRVGGNEDPTVRMWPGTVSRPRKWTLGSEDEAILRVVEGKAAVPDAPKLHAALEQELAARLAASRKPEEVREILDEIAKKDRSSPPPMTSHNDPQDFPDRNLTAGREETQNV